MLKHVVLILFLIYFAIIDFKERRIPNKALIVFLIVGFLFSLFGLYAFLTGAFLGLIPPLIIYLVKKGGIGFGDVKLFAVLGAFVGSFEILLIFAITFILGGIFAIIMIMIKKSDIKKIPLVPFILGSTLIILGVSLC